MSEATIYVWNPLQIQPATLYGKAHYGEGFKIEVSADPAAAVRQAEKEGRKALCYHFGSSSSGGGGR